MAIPDIEDIPSHLQSYHSFSENDTAKCRSALLSWYTANRRKLPWRGDAPPFGAKEVEQTKLKKSSSASITSFFKSNKPKESISQLEAAKPASSSSSSLPVSNADGSDIFPLQPWPNPYATWVSEIMLQQTRVETVIEYFLKWMRRFPTVEALASATLDEVNAMWAGLGYYRRAKFLHEGAKTVVSSFGGQLPSTAEQLKKIPGIGDYTAGAIASIAFGEQAPLVDGNVIRVLTRLRAIAAHPKHKEALKLIWSLAGDLVKGERPGDFNQSLMELGATICTPKAPRCGQCPVAQFCLARSEQISRARPAANNVELPSSSSISVELSSSKPSSASSSASAKSCLICDETSLLGEDSNDWDVTRYPLKVEKKAPKEEVRAVAVITRNSSNSKFKFDDPDEVLVVRRPASGLLGGQFEFPAAVMHFGESALSTLPSQSSVQQAIDHMMSSTLNVCFNGSAAEVVESCISLRQSHGNFVHVFSHLRQTSILQHLHLSLHDGLRSKVDSAVDVALTVQKLEDVKEDDENEENGDEEEEKPVKSKSAAKTASKPSSSTSSKDSASSLFSAKWVTWSSLRDLGLTLASQKALEQITGQPWQSKNVKSATDAAAKLKSSSSSSKSVASSSSDSIDVTASPTPAKKRNLTSTSLSESAKKSKPSSGCD